MKRQSDVAIGQAFAANGHGLIWRVERHLSDGVHVVIVRDDDPSRRKTISIWGLLDGDQYHPVGQTSKSGLALKPGPSSKT